MWYAASIFFESVHLPNDGTPSLWEESIRLIEAQNDAEARSKAEQMGLNEKVNYLSATSDQVTWVFRFVDDVCEIQESQFLDGIELFSRFMRTDDAERILTRGERL